MFVKFSYGLDLLDGSLCGFHSVSTAIHALEILQGRIRVSSVRLSLSPLAALFSNSNSLTDQFCVQEKLVCEAVPLKI